MFIKPVFFFNSQKTVDSGSLMELFRPLLIEIAVVFKQPVHCDIKILLQIRTVLVYAEIKIRRADLADRDHIG